MATKELKPGLPRKRRHHDAQFKAKTIYASLQPVISIAAVALANEINPNLLRRWIKEFRQRYLSAPEPTKETCLRLTLPRPKGPADLQAHRFHMTMARILLSHTYALVGYKYCNGVDNDSPEEDVWIADRWIADLKTHSRHRVLPKRLAEPITRLIAVISDLNRNRG